MAKNDIKKKIIKELLNQDLTEGNEKELIDMMFNSSILIDVDKTEDESRTKGDIIADKVSECVGSWTFIICFSLFLLLWIFINFLFGLKAVDPYPFILLNLLLSCIAALQAPIIMMSQNRQVKKDSIRNQNDYRVDLKSELLLEELYENINEVLKNQKKLLDEINKFKTDSKKKK